MNKILDKLGVYDLIAVLLSGISISTFSILVLQLVYKIPMDVNFKVNETLSFLILSYFLGLIFQECSSFIQKKTIHRNNGLLKTALKTSNDSHIFLTKIEKDEVYAYVINKLKLNPNENNDNVVYNYCKFYILKNSDTSRIDRDQSISAMSRSLSLYFALLTITVLINIFFQPQFVKFILIVISLTFTFLFYYRCKRFNKLRYINIFRTFYYNVVVK
ncbi:MAG: hypothetical protein HFH68_13335 [Lachnospiraceae bacterium]|nr:hypothetical protein [Lachnospiraceae bacterium]